MHDIDLDNFNIKLSEISKIEGSASLDITIRNKKIVDLKFSISEWKRFYTQAVRGKPIAAIPQLVDRICGTCSNAHLLASIKAIEIACEVEVSEQTKVLRKLLYYGLIIRDHALHLYIFSLPDIYKKGSILDFDENDPIQHALLEDTFAVKEVGNLLSIVIGGRSVHAPLPTIGGFLKLPKIDDLKNLRDKLLSIRNKILNLVKIFAESDFEFELQQPTIFSGLISDDFSFLDGQIQTSNGYTIQTNNFNSHLKGVVIPYSHARGFKLDGQYLMVGALARLNLAINNIHPKTKASIAEYLKMFPSKNLYHNNLAQAIEILHAIDASVEIIDKLKTIETEIIQKVEPKKSIGVGVIEAPRGTLYYQLEINADGTAKSAEIIVPTGQNQIVMEQGIRELVEKHLNNGTSKEQIVNEIEKFIRAFDPCMSCAAHFLRVKWK